MANFATYADLTAYILTAIDRDDPDTINNVPAFMRYAHDEIVRELRIPAEIKADTGLLDSERVSLPADFQQIISLELTGGQTPPLEAVAPTRRAQMAQEMQSGAPLYYSIEGPVIALAPVPNASYPCTMVYQASPLLMTVPTDTNVIYAKTPWLYVHGALAAAYRFNQYLEQAEANETLFRGQLQMLAAAGRRDAFAGTLSMSPSTGFTP